MDNLALLEYYKEMKNEFLKLEYLKIRVQLSQLIDEIKGITDEYWREEKQKEIDGLDRHLKIIDQVWFFRNHEHIPFEAFDDDDE